MLTEFTELIKMKPSRKKPIEGDVFVLQPFEGVYHFGKVIKTKIKSEFPFVNGWDLVYIYSVSSDKKTMPTELNPSNLLLPPVVVNHQGWLKGYFETIGNLSVTDADKAVDFGFWHHTSEKFYNLEGTPILEPQLWSGVGLVSYGGIGRSIHLIVKGETHLL